MVPQMFARVEIQGSPVRPTGSAARYTNVGTPAGQLVAIWGAVHMRPTSSVRAYAAPMTWVNERAWTRTEVEADF
jgi:hypothetical protein